MAISQQLVQFLCKIDTHTGSASLKLHCAKEIRKWMPQKQRFFCGRKPWSGAPADMRNCKPFLTTRRVLRGPGKNLRRPFPMIYGYHEIRTACGVLRTTSSVLLLWFT